MPTVVFTGGFMILLFGIIILFSIIDKNGLDLEDLKGITSKILLTLRGKKYFHKLLAEYISYRRDDEIKRIPYGDAEEWNKRYLASSTQKFINDPVFCIQELKELKEDIASNKKVNRAMSYLEQNDATVIASKIKKLEKENELLRASSYELED